MKAFFKSKKGIALIVSLLVITLIGVGVGCYFIFRKKLKLDWQKGAIAVNIVENAQYTPDMDKFIEANSGVQGTSVLKTNSQIKLMNSSSEETTSTMTQDEFGELIDEYARVENYAGAGKYQGYDIYEIKNEIKYVVETVPAFNQWFRMPQMRENEGYINIPYYEGWAYYLELDDENRLNITRVCWCTRSRYLDFNNKTTVEDRANGTSFVQYEIMKTKYYENENGKEVVETFLYSVGIDNVKNGDTCNKKTKDYYPFEYQYLKNVKDESLIKYHITSAERYSSGDSGVSDFNFNGDNSAMDIRGLTPYGIRREFTIANYDGYTQVDLTKIDQQFATLNNPEYDGVVNFNVHSNNIKQLVKNIGLSNSEYENSTDCMNLLDKIAKQIIDNFEIKNNWPKIYKDSTDAIEVELIKGPHYGKNVPISDVDFYVSGYNSIHCDIDATIYDISQFDTSKYYSLSVALRNKETGKLYIVDTEYKMLNNQSGNYYTIDATGTIGSVTDLGIVTENGEYDITCVLTVRENGEDVIIFDTLEVGYLRGYKGVIIPNSIDDNGVEHSYKVKGNGGKITITVSSVETNL